MTTTILRLTYGPSLPQRDKRDRALRLSDNFGADAVIREIVLPDSPLELFNFIRCTLQTFKASVIELDSNDRMLTAFLASGACMKVFGNVPVLCPRYDNAGVMYPQCDLSSHLLLLPDGAAFVGFAELNDSLPILTLRPDIQV